MSTHCYRCIIHPHHNKVGVCGLCVRERLVALVEECSSNSCTAEGKRCSSPAASAGSASADGPYHSFSSSSARELHINQLHSPPGAPPTEPPSGSEQPIHLPPVAPTSLLHKLKLRAFISIPPSPERVFVKNGSGFHSPSPATVYGHQKNKLSLPFKSRKSCSVSELTEGLYMHSKVAPEAGDDQISAPSNLSRSVGHRKPSLMTLFHGQSEVAADTTNHTALDVSEKAMHAPLRERRHHIEQFSAAMRSPGFAMPSTKTAVPSDYRQIHTAEYLAYHGAAGACSADQSSSSFSSSWIVSLFQRKKRRAASKSKSKAINSEASLVNAVLEEASARNSVDCLSVDSGGMTPRLKQMIRSSRVQHEEAPHYQMKEVGAKPRSTQGWMAPLDGEHFDAKLDPVTGQSTAKLCIHNEQYMDSHEGPQINLEQAPHFPRSRSWGRAWSRTHSSHFFTASPQHPLLGSSKQHLNNNNAKLSSLYRHQHLNSTPKHPAMEPTSAPKDGHSQLASGFNFGPFRRSKRQGGAPLFYNRQS